MRRIASVAISIAIAAAALVAVPGAATAAPTPDLTSIAPANGPLTGGPLLTISGSGFTGIPDITVGDVACTSPVVINPTTITCVLGAHAAGIVGVTVINDSATPGDTLQLPGSFTYSETGPLSVSTDLDASCLVTANRTLDCWGQATYGAIYPPAGPYTQVSNGTRFACGLTTAAAVACWGGNYITNYGQTTPPAGAYLQVTAGPAHACAIVNDGTLRCWGYNAVDLSLIHI